MQKSINRRSERKEVCVTSVFDIETEDWDIPVLMGMWHTVHDYRETRSIKELADWCRTPGWHWSHNGGKFDDLPILDVWLSEGREVTATFGGGRIIAMRCEASILCDSYAVWPVPLREMTLDGTTRKQKFPLQCRCEKNCDGFCRIRRDMPSEDYRVVSEYLRYDVFSLRDNLWGLQEFYEDNDLDMTFTLGGGAFSTAARYLGIQPEEQSLSEHRLLRRAFYGGMVRSLKLGHVGRSCEMDVVNLYPSRLKEIALPVGARREISGGLVVQAFKRKRPGIYQALVRVPEQHVTPLPVRRNGRLWYPHGTFEDYYTQIELENAVEKYGVEILSFGSAVIYESSEKIFGPFIDHVFAIRQKVGRTTALGTLCKLIPNSLYGKCASRPEKERLLINPRIDLEELEGCSQLGENVFIKKYEMIDRCSHPVWASYVTSASRIMLLDKVYEGSPYDCAYMDTDSYFGSKILPLNVGTNLGQFEIKRCKNCNSEWLRDLVVFAPKVYSKVCECEQISTKAKGISLPRNQLPEIGKAYPLIGVFGAKTFGSDKQTRFFQKRLKRGGEEESRILKSRAGDRILIKDSDGNPTGETRAPHISECVIKERK